MYTRKTSAQAIIYIARRVFQEFPKKMFFILSKLCPFSGILLHRYANRAPIIFNNNTLWKTPSPSAPVTFQCSMCRILHAKYIRTVNPTLQLEHQHLLTLGAGPRETNWDTFPRSFGRGRKPVDFTKKKQCVKMYSNYNNTAQLVYTTHDITIFYQKYVSNCHHD